jgi:hypothetical protein
VIKQKKNMTHDIQRYDREDCENLREADSKTSCMAEQLSAVPVARTLLQGQCHPSCAEENGSCVWAIQI